MDYADRQRKAKATAPVLFSGSGIADPLTATSAHYQQADDDEDRPPASFEDLEDSYLQNALAHNAAQTALATGEALYPSIKQAAIDYTPQAREAVTSVSKSAYSSAKAALQEQDSYAYIPKYSVGKQRGMVVTVSDPVVKEERMLSKYVLYTVRGQDNSGSFETFRRYSDFVVLRVALVRKWPGIYIPGLPPKQILVSITQGNRSPLFIEDRRVMLEDFLERTVQIDFIVTSEEFQLFIRGAPDFERACGSLKTLSIPEIAANYTNHFTNYVNPTCDPMEKLMEEEKFFGEMSEKLKSIKDIAKRTMEQYSSFQSSYNSLSEQFQWLEEQYLPVCLGRDYHPLYKAGKRTAFANPYSHIYDWLKCEVLDCRAAVEAIAKVREMEVMRKRNSVKLESERADLEKLQEGKTLFSQILTFKSRTSGISSLQSSIEKVGITQLTEETQSLGVIMRIAGVRLIEYELPRVKDAKESIYHASMVKFSCSSTFEFQEVSLIQLSKCFRAVSDR